MSYKTFEYIWIEKEDFKNRNSSFEKRREFNDKAEDI